MLEGVYGCFMTCNEFLAGNSEVSLELQCFTAELITHIVCECDAPDCTKSHSPNFSYSKEIFLWNRGGLVNAESSLQHLVWPRHNMLVQANSMGEVNQ